MPTLTIRHVTTYRYRRPVAFGEHRMMLRPREPRYGGGGGVSFNLASLACVSRRRKRAIDNVGDRALAQTPGYAEIRVGVQRSCQPRM